jgi:branched-chain amino acid transport system permease protein
VRLSPIRLRQGSFAHRVYVSAAWLVAAVVILYIPLSADVGFAPGSIDKVIRLSQINQLIAFAVALLGLNIVIGFSGQLSLGHSAFVGTGAYTTVILVADHHWSYLATLPVSALVCFVAGLTIGIPATRVRGVYLAIVTLVVAYTFPSLILKLESLTGGPGGKGPPRTAAKLVPPSWMPFANNGRLAHPLWVYSISIVLATMLFLFARNFMRSRPGRALIAVRDNDASALAMGVNVPLYRAVAFGVSGVYGGLAGSMLMLDRPFASDVQYGPQMAIFLVVALVIGGTGTISGAVPGAFAYVFVPHFVSEWTFDQSGMPPVLRHVTAPLFSWLRPAGGQAVGIFFGLALFLLMLLMPGGFVAAARKLRDRVVTIEPHPAWLDERDPNPSMSEVSSP